jgi:uncharacterized membrane protein YvlD (DUF360 family)
MIKNRSGGFSMVTALTTVAVNTLAFFIIAKILPGFLVKNEKTSFFIAVAYSILMAFSGLIAVPVAALVGVVLTMLAFIPVIGPILAGAGLLVTIFLLTFIITAVVLIIIDKFMDDFEMTSPTVALIASFLLAVINVVIRGVFGV